MRDGKGNGVGRMCDTHYRQEGEEIGGRAAEESRIREAGVVLEVSNDARSGARKDVRAGT